MPGPHLHDCLTLTYPTLTTPTRAIAAVRPQASPGVLGGAVAVAAVFGATPFLLPAVAEQFQMPIGNTGILSTAQVGSFAVAAFLAGRLLRPRRRFHYGALLLVALASLGAAFATNLPMLLVALFITGIGLGTLTWIAWADATRFTRGIGDIAATAPVTASLTSPGLAWLVQQGGFKAVYIALAALAVAVMPLRVDFGDLPRVGRQVSDSNSNRALLLALGVLSLGGSGTFVFVAATAANVQGMSPVAMSWAISINAIAGVVATRLNARPGTAGWWLVACILPNLALGLIASQVVFFLAMVLWGFAWWMAIPAIFVMLADRSLIPSERVGDAQAVMAVGRVVGPIAGGIALGAGYYGRLSAFGAAFTALSAVIVLAVAYYRRTH